MKKQVKILIVISVVIFSIGSIIGAVLALGWWLKESPICRIIYGKNSCNYQAAINLGSSNFKKAMNLCLDIEDKYKKEDCLKRLAETFSTIDLNATQQACEQLPDKQLEDEEGAKYSREECIRDLVKKNSFLKGFEYTIEECDKSKGLKEASIEIQAKEDSIEFTQVLNTYCNAGEENLTLSYEKEDSRLIVTETFDAENVVRCICSFDIKGKIPNLAEGNYTVEFFFENKPMRETTTLETFNNILVGQKTGFCGRSTNGKCDDDFDCITSGCSGQICQSINEDPIITTCEWRDCYNAKAYSLECKCVDNKCQWR